MSEQVARLDFREAEGRREGTRIAIDPARLWHKLDELLGLLNARYHLRSAEWLSSRVTLRGRPHVSNEGRIRLGDRVRLVSTLAPLELVTLEGGVIEIGDRTFINYGSSLVASSRIKVGAECLIGSHVQIMDCDFHRVEDKTWDTTGRPISLGDRVWIANRAILLRGISVGDDAVVATGSVVTKDVLPRTVVAGNPARVVRTF